MQYANCFVALGGDKGNTVPKYAISAAEIAVLRKIHGEDSISEVEPTDPPKSAPAKNGDELKRLKHLYGHARDEDGKAHVEILYPGAAARVHEALDELELDESAFKAETRVKPDAVKATPKKAAKKGGKKGAEQEAETDDADGLAEVEADDENVLE